MKPKTALEQALEGGYQLTKEDVRDMKKQISAHMEDFLSFRDYRFKDAKFFGKTSIASSINILNPTIAEVEDAVSVFCRDGYSTIIIYLGNKE